MEKYNDAYQVFLKDRKINENKNYNKNDIINTVNNIVDFRMLNDDVDMGTCVSANEIEVDFGAIAV